MANIRYGSLTHSQFGSHPVLYDSDPGDTLIMVIPGLSFEKLRLQHYLTVNILGCRCSLGLGVLSLALEMCHLSEYESY